MAFADFTWVETDPLESRSVDALGMQSVVDDLADRFLPSMSVLTRRAGYFSFLCWARNRVDAKDVTREIHRWEITLSAAEGSMHPASSVTEESPDTTCSFLGSRKMRSSAVIPADPKKVYVTTAWQQYRASMVAMGLLEGARSWTLSPLGTRMATTYSRRVGRPRIDRAMTASALLCRIPRLESRLLREVFLGGEDEMSRRRHRLLKFAGKRLALSLPDLLEFARQRPGNDDVSHALAAACVWETLSQGLHGLFLGWTSALTKNEINRFTRALKQQGTGSVRLGMTWPVDSASDTVAISRRLIRRAMRLRKDLPSKAAILLESADAEPLWALAEQSGRTAIIEELAQRHVGTKGDTAWVTMGPNGWHRTPNDRRSVPSTPSFHSYRLSAFRSLMRDIGEIT